MRLGFQRPTDGNGGVIFRPNDKTNWWIRAALVVVIPLEILLWLVTGTGLINFVAAVVVLGIWAGVSAYLVGEIAKKVSPSIRRKSDRWVIRLGVVYFVVLMMGHLWMCTVQKPIRADFVRASGANPILILCQEPNGGFNQGRNEYTGTYGGVYGIVSDRSNWAEHRCFVPVCYWWTSENEWYPMMFEVYIWVPPFHGWSLDSEEIDRIKGRYRL